MDGERPRTPDARIDELEQSVRALEARVAALESWPDRDDRRDEAAAATDADHHAVIPAVDLAVWLGLVGRTLVVLGGAYLLRALTESGLWTPAAGVALAFGYAASWLVIADRSTRVSGIFHGAAAETIAFPLLWEAVHRFHVVGPATASAILAVGTLAILAVAVHGRRQPLAWLAIAGALPLSLALTASTGALLPFAAADIVLGIATLWIGYTVDWVWLRWPAAAVANLAVLALASAAASPTGTAAAPLVVAVQLLLPAGYLASIAIRTLVRGRDVIVFEALQSAAALLAGFGGAVYVARTTGTGGMLLVAMALTCGAGSYATAFAFVARRQGFRRNFHFYTSVALVLVLSGVALGLPEPALWWAALAVTAARLARRSGGPTLAIHAVAYLVAATIASGLSTAVLRALTGDAGSQPLAEPRLLAVFAAACLCWATPAADEGRTLARVSRTAIALIVTAAAVAWIVSTALSEGTAPGVAAAIRTSVLAAAAVGLAWLGGSTRLEEAAWLVYPALAGGALKLFVEDFPRSDAASLFVALAAYGGAMIVAPRLLRAQAGSVPNTRRTN
jgi:hypothetical protein